MDLTRSTLFHRWNFKTTFSQAWILRYATRFSSVPFKEKLPTFIPIVIFVSVMLFVTLELVIRPASRSVHRSLSSWICCLPKNLLGGTINKPVHCQYVLCISTKLPNSHVIAGEGCSVLGLLRVARIRKSGECPARVLSSFANIYVSIPQQ